MRHTAIRISNSYVVPDAQRSALEKASVVYGAAKVAPDEMGGFFSFADLRERPVNADFLRGRWTLLYFGYSRCTGACREAAPIITAAARTLRERGFAARAAFVDIETPHVSPPRMIGRDDDDHVHRYNWPQRFAMTRLFESQGGDLHVLSGNRAQLAEATRAYHVLREHVPPRPEEKGMSINHSSIVYILGPDTFVAAYGYHDVAESSLVALVEQLDTAERLPIDFTAIKSRYLKGACGGDL
jgi:cytochrome oxidase Cu insertion factor (SCO1/SenC/PrrC family)